MYRRTRDGSSSLSTTGLMSEVMVVSGEEAGGLVSGGGLLVSGEAEAGGGGDCLGGGCEAGGSGLLIPGESEASLCSVPAGSSSTFPSFFLTILSSSPSSFFLLSGCPVE